MVNLSYS